MYYYLYHKIEGNITCFTKDKYYINKYILKHNLEPGSYCILEITKKDLISNSMFSR